MTTRPISFDDVRKLFTLWNESAPYDAMSPDLFHEKVWGDDDFDPQLTACVYDGDTPIGMAMAIIRTANSSPRGFLKLLAVHPEKRWQGVGNRLADAVESQLKSRGASEARFGESAPNYLTPGVDEQSHDVCDFLEARGYVRFEKTCNMTVSLRDLASNAEPQSLDDEISIARYTPPLEPAARELLNECWPSWTEEFFAAASNDPPTAFLAMQHTHCVGFAVFDANNRGVGWFGPMGMAPQAQGRGVGRRLLHACLADMSRAGYGRAVIPWVGPTKFYEKTVGAAIDRRFFRYRKLLS